MMVNPVYRRIILYSILLATLAATAYFMHEDSTKEHTNELTSTAVNHTNVSADESASGHAFKPKKGDEARVDIFEVYKKVRAEPKQSLVVAPEIVKKQVVVDPEPIVVAPSAPPVPFKYIGKLWGDDAYQVFIEFKGKYLVVGEGDIIQKTYKIEKIAPPTMTITYMPMNILQNMQIGEIN